MKDNVNHPSHYTRGGVEIIDCIDSAIGVEYEGYYVGNIIKYLSRYRYKNGLEDLKKAQWYLNRLVSKKEEEE